MTREEEEERARERRRREFLKTAQVGLGVFLGVVLLGLLPAFLGARWPRLSLLAALGAWTVAPALVLVVLAWAAVRLWRTPHDGAPRDGGKPPGDPGLRG